MCAPATTRTAAPPACCQPTAAPPSAALRLARCLDKDIGTVSAGAEVAMVLSGPLTQLASLWPVTGYLPAAHSGPAALAVTALAAAILVSAVAAVLVGAAQLSRTSAALPLISRAAAL